MRHTIHPGYVLMPRPWLGHESSGQSPWAIYSTAGFCRILEVGNKQSPTLSKFGLRLENASNFTFTEYKKVQFQQCSLIAELICCSPYYRAAPAGGRQIFVSK